MTGADSRPARKPHTALWLSLGPFATTCVISRGVSVLHNSGGDAKREGVLIERSARYVQGTSRQPGA